MEKNKSNTLLLTVIGVATLLVAVIGATFAYFTAQTQGGESASTIQVTAGTLTIAYDDGSSNVSGTLDEPSSTVPIAEKKFTLTGKNTTDRPMKYNIILDIESNTFTGIYYVGDSPYKAGTTLYTSADSGAVWTNFLKYSLVQMDPLNTNNEAGSAVPGMATNVTKNDVIVSGQSNTASVTMGQGTFAAGANDVVHTYKLQIYYVNDATKNQDPEKEKTLVSKIQIEPVQI